MECKKETNKKSCNCAYPCQRKGVCCECISHHRARGELPACYFDSKTKKVYAQPIEAYLKSKDTKK